MPYVNAQDGTEIYYRDWGAGTPVVLVHGWPLDGSMWEKQANYLVQQNLRVITHDRRGFGLSGQSWNGYDYDTLTADLNAVMEKADVRGATLAGFSMGGGEVVRYLTRFGTSRVNKAVLISAVTPYLMKTRDNPEGVDQKIFDEMNRNLVADRPAFLKTFASMFYGRTMINHTVSEGILEWTLALAFRSSLRPTLASAAAFAETDFRAELPNITIPVRVIHGTSDSTVPIENSGHRAVRLLPNGTMSEYEGEPHGLFITAADRLSAELAEFVTGLKSPMSAAEVKNADGF